MATADFTPMDVLLSVDNLHELRTFLVQAKNAAPANDKMVTYCNIILVFEFCPNNKLHIAAIILQNMVNLHSVKIIDADNTYNLCQFVTTRCCEAKQFAHFMHTNYYVCLMSAFLCCERGEWHKYLDYLYINGKPENGGSIVDVQEIEADVDSGVWDSKYPFDMIVYYVVELDRRFLIDDTAIMSRKLLKILGAALKIYEDRVDMLAPVKTVDLELPQI